jgi:rRNA maturation RNase YbeY
MIIHILNRQKFWRPDTAALKQLIAFLLDKSGKCPVELSVILTDDAGIRQINRQFFDCDCATDVISFTLPSRSGTGGPIGEIALNVERAIQEGKKRRGFEHEFALYLAHGCDHLAGHTDRTVKERIKMRRRELRWLKGASGHNLL